MYFESACTSNSYKTAPIFINNNLIKTATIRKEAQEDGDALFVVYVDVQGGDYARPVFSAKQFDKATWYLKELDRKINGRETD